MRPLDESFLDAFKKVLKSFGRLDIVVNNAGIANETYSTWKKMVDLNYSATVHATELGIDYMGKHKNGRGGIIVNTGSVTCLKPFPSLAIYSGTKAAINQMSRSFGSEVYYKLTGVKVMVINPGRTETQLIENTVLKDLPGIQESFSHEPIVSSTQSTEIIGRGLLKVLDEGKNGSLWTIENDEPPKESEWI